MRISLLAAGSLKTAFLREGCAEYAERIGHDAKFSVSEVAASKAKDTDRQRAEECEALSSRLAKTDGEVWVLDERGKGMTSAQFADALSALSDRGVAVTFVLGGAYGLDDAVRSRADRVIRLSDMTLPHELCRLVFLEQLYRALQIRRGTGYHH